MEQTGNGLVVTGGRLIHSKETRCWWVHVKDDRLGTFVFARTRAEAIYKSDAYQDCLDWVIIRAFRVPLLDGKEINRANVEAAGYTWCEMYNDW